LRIALATCEHPIEHDDDLDFLVPALIREGVEVESPGWSKAGVDWESFDLVLLSSTWDYHERVDEFRAWLDATAAVTRLRNPLELIEWNLDKRYLRELELAGVPTIPTVWIEPGSEADAAAALEERGWPTVVIKPVIDLGARNLVRVDAEMVAPMLDRFEVATMAQPYLASVAERGEVSLVYLAGELSLGVRKIPARGDFRIQPQYGGTHEPFEPTAESIEIAERALAVAPGDPLYARVDLVWLDDGSLALIELELIEPALYLDVDPSTVPRFARALMTAAS